MDLERSNRIATSLQNRIFKGYQALSYFHQLEASDTRVIKNTELPILSLDMTEPEGKSKEDNTENVEAEKVI